MAVPVPVPDVILGFDQLRALASPMAVTVQRRSDGGAVEHLTVLRHAGHYRGLGDSFAVKDAEGKFRLRTARQLGLLADSPNQLVALDITQQVIDLSEASIPAA